MRLSHPILGGAMLALALGACSSAPTDRLEVSAEAPAFRPLAVGGSPQGSLRWDEATRRTYLAVPARMARRTPTTRERSFSRTNWSYSVKQQGRVQVYIVQTPDWFEVVEQELPRHQQVFNRVEEAIAYANERYADWSLVSLEP